MVNTGADLFACARMAPKQRGEVFAIFIVDPITRPVALQHGTEMGFGVALSREFARRELYRVPPRQISLPIRVLHRELGGIIVYLYLGGKGFENRLLVPSGPRLR